MPRTDTVSSDWEHQPVPMAEREPFYRIAATWAGFVFVPLLINFAYQLGSRMQLGAFLLSVFLAGSILAVCSAVSAVIAQRTGLSSGLMLQRVFGTTGGRIAALITPLCLIGWNSFSLDFAGSVTAGFLHLNDMHGLLVFAYMIPFAVTATIGFKLISRMSVVAVPVMALLLGLGLVVALGRYELADTIGTGTTSEPIPSAVTKIVGLFALGAALCSPDIQRFSRTARSACLVAVTTFCIAFPFVFIVGGLTATLVAEGSLMGSFSILGLAAIGFAAFVLLTWTTCDNDYYSAALGVAVVTGLPKKAIVLPLATVAALIASLGIGGLLEPWLIIMTSIAVPLAGVFLSEGMFISEGISQSEGGESFAAMQQAAPRLRLDSLVAWVAGAAVSYLTARSHLGIPPLQGMVVAFTMHALLRRLVPAKGGLPARG